MLKISLMAAGLALAFASAGQSADKPQLNVYTYDSFTSEWGPGPQVKTAFEAICDCELKFTTAGDGAALLARLQLEGSHSKADVVLGLDTNLTARALATGPKLLLLDEIAGGLTEAVCHDLIALIKEIRAAGATIVWIEHVLHALLAVVDRVLVLDFGKVIAEGAPDDIMKDPQVAAVYLGPGVDEREGEDA